MAYLVRKINNKRNIDSLTADLDFNSLSADVPTGEFRTTNGTLSTWIINFLDELDEAVLAIAVTSSKISRMDFIVLDTDILSKYKLEYKQTYAGRNIAIPDLQDTHYDIIDLSMEKLKACVRVYKEIVDDDSAEKYIVRYVAGQIKDLMKNALSENRVAIEQSGDEIKAMFLRWKDAKNYQNV